jgi:hypothetical protein
VWVSKALLAALLFLATSMASQPQKAETPEEMISRIIYMGYLEGHYDKVIRGSGDAAAVSVTKIVRERNLSPDEIDRVLVVLNMAFGSEPNGPDAEPKTALFVLRELDLSTNDAQLRARIAQTRKYVQDEFAKSTKPSLPN